MLHEQAGVPGSAPTWIMAMTGLSESNSIVSLGQGASLSKDHDVASSIKATLHSDVGAFE
jgi:hypothetical protein